MRTGIDCFSGRSLGFIVLLLSLVFCSTTAVAAESTYDTIKLASAYILEQQNPDGGWPILPGQASDVEVTAMAMKALMLKGWGTGSGVIRKGVSYLTSRQHGDGSWNGNTAHTIFALIALRRAETDPEARRNALQWLKEVQNEDGSWGREIHQPGNPLYTAAVLAGLGELGFDQSLSMIPKAANWLADRINPDEGWSMGRGERSDVLVTSWVLQGLSLVYDIDQQIVWLKKMQNEDGGFGKWANSPSDPEITAYAILALAAGKDPLNTDQVAIAYLRRVQQADGSFVSGTPIEITESTANLQTTCFAMWAIYAKEQK